MKCFRGKRAVITGAASGIGRALAIKLAQAGCQCCLIDRDAPGLNQVIEQTPELNAALTFQCDLGDRTQLDATLDRLIGQWPDIDILINNAGITFRGSTDQMSDTEWRQVLAVNLIAPIHITHRLLPILLERPESHIVNVCSLLGLCGISKFSAYCSSKFGLVGFTESLRAEYLGSPLKVHSICPGFVRTRFIESVPGTGGSVRTRSTPRWLCTSPEAVANACITAMRRNRGMVVLTPLANLLWRAKRFTPFVLSLPGLWKKRWKKTGRKTHSGENPPPS